MTKKISPRARKVKPFNAEKFIKLARELREAVKKEEKRYGPVVPAS